MKKLFTSVALILILVVSSNVNAQSFAIGLEAGINLANANITPTPTGSTFTNRTGLIVGAVADIGFTPQLALTTGMRYVMKGATQTGTIPTQQGNVNGEVIYKNNYLEFPVLLKYRFALTEVKPYIIAGPTIGLKLTADYDFAAAGFVPQNGIDNSSNVESIDFGLLFGAGMDFNVGAKAKLFVQGAYSLGISNIAKTPPGTVGTPSTTKTNGIQLTTGVKFSL